MQETHGDSWRGLYVEENVLRQFPLLKGEGGAKHRVRGEEKNLCTPHLPLRGTLSLRERVLLFSSSSLKQPYFARVSHAVKNNRKIGIGPIFDVVYHLEGEGTR
jgi:hypothetical protein